jgi:transcriptional regulator with XRE-family HTH domain
MICVYSWRGGLRGAERMPVDDDHEDTEDEVAVARAGVQGFSPAALRRQRNRVGLTLRQLSLLSGVSTATINGWENGKVVPSPRPLAAVAAALGIEVGDLVPVKEARLTLVGLRHQAGLNQQEAADTVGLSRTMFQSIESGFRAADQEQRALIVQLYGITEEKFDQLWERTRDTLTARLKAR